jgi:hypothetical protein
MSHETKNIQQQLQNPLKVSNASQHINNQKLQQTYAIFFLKNTKKIKKKHLILDYVSLT